MCHHQTVVYGCIVQKCRIALIHTETRKKYTHTKFVSNEICMYVDCVDMEVFMNVI